jgi:hypothetical protein
LLAEVEVRHNMVVEGVLVDIGLQLYPLLHLLVIQ